MEITLQRIGAPLWCSSAVHCDGSIRGWRDRSPSQTETTMLRLPPWGARVSRRAGARSSHQAGASETNASRAAAVRMRCGNQRQGCGAPRHRLALASDTKVDPLRASNSAPHGGSPRPADNRPAPQVLSFGGQPVLSLRSTGAGFTLAVRDGGPAQPRFVPATIEHKSASHRRPARPSALVPRHRETAHIHHDLPWWLRSAERVPSRRRTASCEVDPGTCPPNRPEAPGHVGRTPPRRA
jgi:hypothetical protein